MGFVWQLSRGEQLYKRQLEEWSAKVVRLGDQLAAVQRLVPRQAQPLAISSTPATPTAPSSQALVASSQGVRSPPAFASPAPGPSPILPSASPQMASWRSPSFTYESSARRGPAFLTSGPPSDRKQSGSSSSSGSSLRFSALGPRSSGGVSGTLGQRGPLLSEDEQAACQQLLAAQLDLIANSNIHVLALQERLRGLERVVQRQSSEARDS